MLMIRESLGNEKEISVGENRVMYRFDQVYVVSEKNEKCMGTCQQVRKRALVPTKRKKIV